MSNLSADFRADCGCHIECQPRPCSASWDQLSGCLHITCACVSPCRVSVKLFPCNPEKSADPEDGVKTANMNSDYQHHPEEQQNNDALRDGDFAFPQIRRGLRHDNTPNGGPSQPPGRRYAFAGNPRVTSPEEELRDRARAAEEQNGRQKGRTPAKPPRYSAADEEVEEIQTYDSCSSGGEALGYHNKKKKIRTGKAKPKDRKYFEVDEEAEASQSSYSRSPGGETWGR